MKAKDYPFAKELRKVIIVFSYYQRLLEAIEDEGLILAMTEVKNEIPLNLNEALVKLENV